MFNSDLTGFYLYNQQSREVFKRTWANLQSVCVVWMLPCLSITPECLEKLTFCCNATFYVIWPLFGPFVLHVGGRIEDVLSSKRKSFLVLTLNHTAKVNISNLSLKFYKWCQAVKPPKETRMFKVRLWVNKTSYLLVDGCTCNILVLARGTFGKTVVWRVVSNACDMFYKELRWDRSQTNCISCSSFYVTVCSLRHSFFPLLTMNLCRYEALSICVSG